MTIPSRRQALTAAAALFISAAAGCAPPEARNRVAIDDGLKGQELVLHLVLHDKVYFKGAPLRNVSKEPLTLRKVSMGAADEQVRLIDMRIYQIKDFGEGPPAMWSSSNKKGLEAVWDPSENPSVPVAGRTIQPGKTLISVRREWIMLELEVDRVGTYRTRNVIVEYKQAGELYRQKLSSEYVLVVARTEADRQKFIDYWLSTGKIAVAK